MMYFIMHKTKENFPPAPMFLSTFNPSTFNAREKQRTGIVRFSIRRDRGQEQAHSTIKNALSNNLRRQKKGLVLFMYFVFLSVAYFGS